VQEVGSDHLWVALAAGERGLLSAVESSADPQEISDCSTRFSVGQALTCRVIEVRACVEAGWYF
jgi:ribosomal protein S1